MSPARTQTRPVRSGDEHANYKATAPPTSIMHEGRIIFPHEKIIQSLPPMYIYFLTKVFAFQNPQSLAWSWDKDIEYWFWIASGKYLSQSSGITGSTKSRRSTIWWSAKYYEHIQKKSVSVEFPENMTTAFSFLHGFNEVSNGLKKDCKSINGTIIYNFFSLWAGCGKNWFQSVWWPFSSYAMKNIYTAYRWFYLIDQSPIESLLQQTARPHVSV